MDLKDVFGKRKSTSVSLFRDNYTPYDGDESF